MKLKKLNHNEDYVRFSKDLIIEVNPIVTAEINVYGGLNTVKSKKYGNVTMFEDADPCPSYYVSGEKLKYSGFKEFYNKLFTGSFEDFEKQIMNFAIFEVAKTYDNHLLTLSRKEKINLLKELIDQAPTFKSLSKQTVLYRQWACNEVLESLGEKCLPSVKYTISKGGGETRYGVLKQDYLNIYEELKKSK
jgi:hypothetical protein